MANQKVWEMEIGGVGNISIEYNDANNRIGNISFVVPAGVSYHVQIRDQGSLIYDQTYPIGSYSESIPGNYRVVIVDDEGIDHPVLPPELSHYVAVIRS